MPDPSKRNAKVTVYARSVGKDQAVARARDAMDTVSQIESSTAQTAIDDLSPLDSDREDDDGWGGLSDDGRVRLVIDAASKSVAGVRAFNEDFTPDLLLFSDLGHDAGSPRVLNHLARKIIGWGVDVYDCETGTRLTESDLDALSIALGASQSVFAREFAGPQAWSGGRPPLGFRSVGGELLPTKDYTRVLSTVRAVDRGDLSKRKAADKLDCARSTIARAVNERRDLYTLDREEDGNISSAGQTNIDRYTSSSS